jgi:hypothetical protein
MLTARDGIRGYQIKDLSRCARREVEMRRRVYARWVDKEKMTQEQADAEIDKMEAIAELLDGMDEAERLL